MSNLITIITNIELPSNHYLDTENIYHYLVQELAKDLNSQDKENYLEFLDAFFKVWNLFYDTICHQEYHNYKHNRFDDKGYDFSIGFDEFITEYGLADYQNFITINRIVRILRNKYSLEETQIIIRNHLRLFATNEKITFSYEEYQKNDIYHFKGRINLYYQNFIKQFDEERRNGLRRSYILDTDEIKSYLQNHFREFNPYFDPCEKQKKL